MDSRGFFKIEQSLCFFVGLFGPEYISQSDGGGQIKYGWPGKRWYRIFYYSQERFLLYINCRNSLNAHEENTGL